MPASRTERCVARWARAEVAEHSSGPLGPASSQSNAPAGGRLDPGPAAPRSRPSRLVHHDHVPTSGLLRCVQLGKKVSLPGCCRVPTRWSGGVAYLLVMSTLLSSSPGSEYRAGLFTADAHPRTFAVCTCGSTRHHVGGARRSLIPELGGSPWPCLQRHTPRLRPVLWPATPGRCSGEPSTAPPAPVSAASLNRILVQGGTPPADGPPPQRRGRGSAAQHGTPRTRRCTRWCRVQPDLPSRGCRESVSCQGGAARAKFAAAATPSATVEPRGSRARVACARGRTTSLRRCSTRGCRNGDGRWLILQTTEHEVSR